MIKHITEWEVKEVLLSKERMWDDQVYKKQMY